jgi:hypothetical protein
VRRPSGAEQLKAVEGARLYMSGARRPRGADQLEAAKGTRPYANGARRTKGRRAAAGCEMGARLYVSSALSLGAERAEQGGLARGQSGGTLDDEMPHDGDSRDGLRAKLGAARAEPSQPEGLPRGSNGALDDEAPHDGDGRDGLQVKLGAALAD